MAPTAPLWALDGSATAETNLRAKHRDPRVAKLYHEGARTQRSGTAAREENKTKASAKAARKQAKVDTAGDNEVLVLMYVCTGSRNVGCSPQVTRTLRAESATQLGRRLKAASSQFSQLAATPPHGRRLEGRYEGIPNWMRASIMRKAQYASRHNFSFYLGADEAYQRMAPRPRSWGVLAALQDAVAGRYGGCRWVWYIDLDTVITDPSRSVLQSAGLDGSSGRRAEHVFMTRDQNGFNTCSILARCTKRSEAFFEAVQTFSTNNPHFDRICVPHDGVMRCGVYHPWNWQLAVQQMMMPSAHRHGPRHLLGVLPQSTINSYPATTWGTRSTAAWRPGHFLVHLAGCGDQRGRSCAAEMSTYTTHLKTPGRLSQARGMTPSSVESRPLHAPWTRRQAWATTPQLKAAYRSHRGDTKEGSRQADLKEIGWLADLKKRSHQATGDWLTSFRAAPSIGGPR